MSDAKPRNDTIPMPEADERVRVAIGSDHRGGRLKEKLTLALREDRYAIRDCVAANGEATDFPGIAEMVARTILAGDADLGIVVSASGAGASLAANKLAGIRAVHCQDTLSASDSRRMLDANLLALGARAVGQELAVEIARTWVRSEFSGDERHERLRRKIEELEEREGSGAPAGG